ncbi:sporulation protein YqfC [Clostridia bacterium]|nr:sporulation protein YqfC [Clostridia bacterium]
MKTSAREHAARLLSLPADIVAGLPRVQIVGCREILVENHKGVLLCEPNAIDIGGDVIIKLRGEGLVIAAMNAADLLVRGQIFSVEFEY